MNYNRMYADRNFTTKTYNPNKFNAFDAVIALICFLAIYYLVRFTFPYLLEYLYLYGVETNNLTLQSYYFYSSLSTVILGALLVGFAFFYAKIRNVNLLNGGGLLIRKKMSTDYMMVILLVLGMITVISYVNYQLSSYFTVLEEIVLGSTSTVGNGFDLENTEFILFYLVIATAVIPAISEEVIFRGIIMRGLEEYGKTAAVVISAVLFAFAHCSVDQLAYQFLVGLAIGFIVYETKSLACGMFLHFFNNLFASLLEIIKNALTINTTSYIELGYYISITNIFTILIGTVCLVIAIIYFGKRFLNTQKTKDKKGSFGSDEFTYVLQQNETNEEKQEKWYNEIELNGKSSTPDTIMIRQKQVKINKKSNRVVAGILVALIGFTMATLIVLSFLQLL